MPATTPPAVPPAARRRFWVTVLCFAAANLGAWAAYVRYDRAARDASRAVLRVDRFAPGDGATVAPRPTLSWTFNLDAAPAVAPSPAAAPAEPTPADAVGTIAPPVAGRWAWADARTLTFTPDDELPRATRFTLTLPPDRFRTRDGFRLDRPFVATLQTAPLELVGARQAGVEDERFILELQFNDTVLPADVLAHVKLTDPDGKPLGCALHGEAAGRTVRLRTDPVAGGSGKEDEVALTVRVAAGLAGRGGPLGLAAPIERRVGVTSALTATDASAYAPSSGKASVHVSFNRDVDVEALRQVLSIEPAVPFTLSRNWRGVQLTGAFEPATRYAVKLAPPPAGAKANAFPRPTTLSVFVPDRPASVWFEHEEGYLGANGNRTVMARAVNVPAARVTVARVYDNNVVAWRNATSRRRWTEAAAFARPVASKRIELSREKNKPVDVPLSLDDLLPAGAPRDGVYLIGLSADDGAKAAFRGRNATDLSSDHEADDDDTPRPTRTAMVTLSDVGLTAKRGRDGLTVWAVSLRTAEPLANLRVRLFSDKGQPLGEGRTGSDGLVRLEHVPPAPGERPSVVLADRGAADVDASAGATSAGLTWLDLRGGEVNFAAAADTGGRPYVRQGYEAFVYTDRGVYRPGETVRLRAVVRGGADGATPPRFPVRWQFRRPDLRDWKSEMTELDADGAAGVDLQLPADLPTGRWSAHVGLSGDAGPAAKFFGSATFQVEEFIPDRMKVGVTFDGAHGPLDAAARHRLGGPALGAAVRADYLFGQPAAGLPSTVVARIEPVTFEHEKWRGWTFGDAANTAEVLGGARPLARRQELPVSTLDKNGRARWEMDVASLIDRGDVIEPSAATRVRPKTPSKPGIATGAYVGPWRLSVAASVTETGGRAVTAHRSVDIDPVPYYLALRGNDATARPGEAATFPIALVAPTGEVAGDVGGDVEVTLYREAWNTSLVHNDGRYRYESTRLLEPVGKAQRVTLTQGRATATVTPPDGGSFVLRLRDPRTVGVATRGFYATHGAWDDNISREDPERLELVIAKMPQAGAPAAPEADAGPDAAPRFRPGEQAQVIVRSPFPGRLLLSVETDDVVSTRVVEMPRSQIAVPIDVTDACRPNAYVTASVVRAVEPDAKWQPHRAAGVARLLVDNGDRRLHVAFAAPAEVRPSTTLSAAVRVTDAAGRPVGGAAVTVAAVDEGICQLTNFATPDPFAFFTGVRALAVRSADVYSQLMPEVARPDRTSAVGGDGDGDKGDGTSRHTTPIVAKRVRPVALWAGVLHTGADGIARAEFPVPQFTGQLRLMAVAYNGGGGDAPPAFGSADAPVPVRSPLLVQSSWPRFAAPGDRFAVPLTLFNNTAADGEATVTVHLDGDDGTNPLAFAARGVRSLTLLPVRVDKGGQATAAFDVAAGGRAGVARVRLVATLNGETYEESVELPVRPANPLLTDGGFAVATPATPCSLEIPGDTLDGTGRAEVRVTPWPALSLPQGLDYLERYPYGCLEQTTSTCFPLAYLGDVGEQIAPGAFDPERVAAKVRAGVTRLIGMQTAGGGLAMWAGGREAWPWGSVYAAHFLVEAKNAGHDVPDDFRDALLGYVRGLLHQSGDDANLVETQAYACYVLALAGRPERAAMSRLAEVIEVKPPASGGSYDARTSAGTHLAAAWLVAGRRDLAAGMIPRVLPAPRASRQLGGNVGSPVRDRAVLLSTLLAIDPQRPELPALAQQLADAGRDGQWRSTQDAAFAVMALGRYLRQAKAGPPYAGVGLWRGGERLASAGAGETLRWDAASAGDAGLEVRVTGPAGAKAHVSWLRTGVPVAPVAQADNGLQVRRRYLDRSGQPVQAGAVRSGDLVQVELALTSAGPLENVVIEDLLPAGFEVENPRLSTSAAAAAAAPARDAPANPFADDRLDVRDDRIAVIGKMTAGGTGTYVYTARAVAPGSFAVPPVRAECMYDLGTRSVSGGGTLRVLPADAGRVATGTP